MWMIKPMPKIDPIACRKIQGKVGPIVDTQPRRTNPADPSGTSGLIKVKTAKAIIDTIDRPL